MFGADQELNLEGSTEESANAPYRRSVQSSFAPLFYQSRCWLLAFIY